MVNPLMSSGPFPGRDDPSEPARNKELEDVGVELIQRLRTGGYADVTQIPVVVVLEAHPVPVQIERALLQPGQALPVKFPAGSQSEREALEGSQLPVACHEILRKRVGKQVGVEVGVILSVITRVRVDCPAVEHGLGVAQLKCMADDSPGVAVVAVVPVEGCVPGQVILELPRTGVAGARMRVLLGLG